MTTTTIQGTGLLRSREAAEFIGVSLKTLWILSAPRGTLPVVKVGKSVRYDMADLKKWIEEQKVRHV